MPDGKASPPVMSSVDKALSLLSHFTVARPEIGLSELSRAAGLDKTTVLRCVNALIRNDFIEQDPETRRYRLGLAPLHLARVREAAHPVASVIGPVLDRLAGELQETAHASLLTHGRLQTLAVAEPNRASRVHLDPSEPIHFHATASGIAYLAALPETERAACLGPEPFETMTPATPADHAALAPLIAAAAAEGIGRSRGTYEDDVAGTAVAIFGASGRPLGAVAVAAVASRLDAVLAARIDTALRRAGQDISRHMGHA